MSQSTASLLERLRGQIRKLEAAPRELLMALRTGLPELDALGVFRLGGAVELTGEEASGRTTVAMSVVAAVCREQRLAAWVDGPQELYPPAALSLGVELERLLIVRPKAPRQLVWAAVQLLRSGAFTCVVLDVTHTGLVLSLTETKKLLDAARAGGSLLVLLTGLAAGATGLVRLTLRQAPPRPWLKALTEEPASTFWAPEIDGLSPEADDGPVFELEAPHGKRTQVPRARLSRCEVVPLRRAAQLAEAPGLLHVVASDSLKRRRRNLERDGYPGFPGTGRPGREGPLTLPRAAEPRTTQPGARAADWPALSGRNWK